MKNHQIKFISEIISNDIDNRKNNIKNYKILELGCGDGRGVHLIRDILNAKYKDCNIELFGLDYQAESQNVVKAKYNDKNLFKLKNTSQRYPFKSNTFDYIYSNQVFEHVEDIDFLVENIQRVLKNNGINIVLYPEKNIIREPHCLIPFVHRIRNKKIKKLIVKKFYPIFNKNNKKIIDSEIMAEYIVNFTFYRSRPEIRKAFSKKGMWVRWPIIPSYATFNIFGESFPKKNKFTILFLAILNNLWVLWKSSLFISKKVD